MALDSTVGAASADSYSSVEEADAYHAARGYNDEWTSAATAEKEKHLKWAAREMDARFTFIGRKATREQGLAWPRYDAWDEDGFLIDSAEVPKRLKNAQAEFAFQLMKEDWTQGLDSVVDEGVSVGALRTSRERHNPIPAPVAALLSPLVLGGAGDVRSLDVVLG